MMDAIGETQNSKDNPSPQDRHRHSQTSNIKAQKAPLNLSQLWTKIIKNSKSSQQKILSHANLIRLDRELNLAVLAVEAEYVAKFQKNTTTLSRIITQCLKQQQPIEIIIEEQK